MGTSMDNNKLKALAAELAKDLKSEKDLGALTQELVKLTVETALNAELDEHLGYEKHDPAGNSRNGSTRKRLKGQHGEVTMRYLQPYYPLYSTCRIVFSDEAGSG